MSIGAGVTSSLPALFKGSFTITGKPKDTFLDMKVRLVRNLKDFLME